MYPAPFNYHRAKSVVEAVDLLSGIGEGARVLAGGQSLLVWLKLRFDEPTDIIDIGRIPNLDAINVAGDRARAHELLGEALDAYRILGMPRHLDMVKKLLND